MKKPRNLFKEILGWAYKRQENGFLEEDLKNELNLSDKQFKWYLGIFRGNARREENLINHLDYSGQDHLFYLSDKGVSKYFEYQKSWLDKPIGKIFFIIIGVIIGIIIKEFWSYLASY